MQRLSEPFCHQCAAGGPYSYSVDIVDNNGCVDDTTVEVTVNEKPVAFVGGTLDVCRYDTVAIDVIPIAGVAPLTVQWTPSNVENDTLFSTFAYMGTSGQSFCAVLTDAIGCQSDPECQQININPQPSINAASANLCATSPVLQNTFTVTGPSLGSTFSWSLSPNYSLITGAAADSSSITVTFPQGVVALQFYRRYRRQHHRLPGHGQHHLLDRSRIEHEPVGSRFDLRRKLSQPQCRRSQLVCLDCKPRLHVPGFDFRQYFRITGRHNGIHRYRNDRHL